MAANSNIKRVGIIGRVARWIADRAYFHAVMFLPNCFDGWMTIMMRCRFYFEQRTETSWPWAWVAFADGHMLVSGFGDELGFFHDDGYLSQFPEVM
jgi:hypothetical protein